MLRLFLVLTCVAAAFAQLEEAHPAPEPYSFAFSSPNEDGTSSSREETGDASGRVTGSYTILGADGQQRRVEYVADQDGFRANVITNEIGTESQNAADVGYQSSAPTAAELTAQWEASGAGKARLAVPAVGQFQQSVAVATGAGPVARPVLRGAIGINRGVGLVQAPIAPIGGGIAGVQNLRFNQGFGIRAQGIAPIGQAVVAQRAVALPAPVAAVQFSGPKVAQVQTGFARTQGLGPQLGLGLNQGVSPFGLGVNGLDLNQLNLGTAPFGVQGYGGLPLRGNLGANGNVLLLSSGQLHPQLSGASNTVVDESVQVKSDAFGRKY